MSRKKEKTSKYRGVKRVIQNGKPKWECTFWFNREQFRSSHDEEREAAKQYDILCIKHGRKPKNILKPK